MYIIALWTRMLIADLPLLYAWAPGSFVLHSFFRDELTSTVKFLKNSWPEVRKILGLGQINWSA